MPRPPNVPLLRALPSPLDGIWGVLTRSWGGAGGFRVGVVWVSKFSYMVQRPQR